MSGALAALLPLVVFYAVERLVDLRAAILATIAVSVLDVAVGRWRSGRVNRLVLLSAALVCLLGGLSLLSEDERFVLWTPVIGDLVFASLLAGSLLGPTSALELAAREQQPDLDLDAPMRDLLRGITGRFALNLLAHAAISAWATTQSRELWLLITGVGQYAMFAGQVALELVLVRRLPPLDTPAPGEDPP